MKEKKCPVCGRVVLGRTDKKFCCDDCRTEYHNLSNRKLRQTNPNRFILRDIYHNINSINHAGSKKFLKILSRLSKLLNIMSTFAMKRKQ
ncbi:MAG: hypothetical protein J6Z32_03005 [Bacteroidales bacterium]|nr:hypothetical protein [Bacteroidales bacterium]